MKNIYLMARYQRHREMQGVALCLRQLGYHVTSRWILGGHQASDAAIGTGTLGDFERQLATDDVEDLRVADLCIGFSEPLHTPSRGGRHVELGMALAWGKRIIVVGGHEHLFHVLPSITHVPDHAALYALLGQGASSNEHVRTGEENGHHHV